MCPCYGNWHAYNFCGTHVARRFYPLVVYFRKGILKRSVWTLNLPQLSTSPEGFRDVSAQTAPEGARSPGAAKPG